MSFTLTLSLGQIGLPEPGTFGYDNEGTNVSMILGPGCTVNWGDDSAPTTVTTATPLPPHSCGNTIIITGPNTLTSMRLEGNFEETNDKGKWISSVSGTLPSKLVSLYLSVDDDYTNTLVFPKTLTTLHYIGNGPKTDSSPVDVIFPPSVTSIRLPKEARFVNIANCSKLTLASIYSTPIKSQIEKLFWPDNLKTIDFSLFTLDGGGPNLNYFFLSGNGLTSINFTQDIDFLYIDLRCPKLTTMPIFKKSSLQYLNLRFCAIKNVNFSNCTSLTDFSVPAVATNLNLSGCTSLLKVSYEVNFIMSKLTSLNANGCTSLERVVLQPTVKTVDLRNTALATALQTAYTDNSSEGLYIVNLLFTIS
jgi:hypothetical protein